jgi:hypothetical protein
MALVHIGNATTLAALDADGLDNADVAYIYLNNWPRKMVLDKSSTKANDTTYHPYYIRANDFSEGVRDYVWVESSDDTRMWDGSSIATGSIHSVNWSTSEGSEIDLDAGTIKLGGSSSPAFSVTAAGVLTATGADISGTMTATLGHVGGWVISANTIEDSTGGVGLSSTATGGDDIRFWAGNSTPSSAPFKVTKAGVLTSTSGSIGGWSIGADSLTSTLIGLHSVGYAEGAEILLGHATAYASAKIGLKADGSGKLADGNISWTAAGILTAQLNDGGSMSLDPGADITVKSKNGVGPGTIFFEYYSGGDALLSTFRIEPAWDAEKLQILPDTSGVGDITIGSNSYRFDNAYIFANNFTQFRSGRLSSECASISLDWGSTLLASAWIGGVWDGDYTGITCYANDHTLVGVSYIEFMVDDSVMMTLKSGKVGIGTTSPYSASLLHVSGSSNVGLVVESTDSVSKIGIYDNASTNPYSVAIGAIGNEMTLHAGSGGGEVVRIDDSGNVGIGTASPGYELEVSGDIYASGDVSALTFTDRTPYFTGDALAAIKNIKGKNGEIDHSTLPSFAQKTLSKKIINEETKEDEIIEETGRDLGAMISILTKAVQQISDRLDAIESGG